MVGIYIKALMKGASKVSPTIKSVKPNVPTTKKEKALSKLAIAKQKTKGSAAKLKQTLFNLKEDRKKLNLREKKMGGGMMGRRFGYSEGKLVGNQKKIDVAAPFGTINEKDFKKLREGKRMQAKDGLTGDTELNKKLKDLSNSLMKVDRRGKPEDFMRSKSKKRFKKKKGSNVYRRKP